MWIILFLTSLAWANDRCPTSFDELEIPHVSISSEKDYYYCFGLHHGRDRSWQMDYFRRSAMGRNAEVYGHKNIRYDFLMRILSLDKLADKIWQSFPESKRWILNEYTAGVNEGFKIGKFNEEFVRLKYSPEPWRPTDSILVLLIQSFDQTRKNFLKDIEEEKALEIWGDQKETLYDEEKTPWFTSILKEGEYQTRVDLRQVKLNSQQTMKRVSHKTSKFEFPSLFGIESGSNNWVIDKTKSSEQVAILANDPHLDLKTPLFWYWIHFKGPFEIIGASLPGVPAIASGTNLKNSWGLTNSYYNSADAYFIKNIDTSKIIKERPVIWFNFKGIQLPFFFKSIQRLGFDLPLIPIEFKKNLPLLLSWSGYKLTAQDILPMFDLYKVQTSQEMDDLLKQMNVPSWNFVFSDIEGKIGFRTVGRLYESTKRNSFGITTKEFNSLKLPEILNPINNPSILNPHRGYIITANNQHYPIDAKYYGGRAYSASFRAKEIERLLTSKEKIDLQLMKDTQCDTRASDVDFMLVSLLNKIDRSQLKGDQLDMINQLSLWKGQTHFELKEPGYYRRWIDLLMEKWIVEEKGVYQLLLNPNQEIIADVTKSYIQAHKDISNRSWGEIHQNPFSHLSNLEELNFSPTLPTRGDKHSINPGVSRWDDKKKIYVHFSGASMRAIYVMKEHRPEIWLSLPGLNRSYSVKSEKNPWLQWQKCGYTKLNW